MADMPGADLPPVIAPPGRTRGNARARQQTGSLSRPSSIHVDDFQQRQNRPEGSAAPPVPPLGGGGVGVGGGMQRGGQMGSRGGPGPMAGPPPGMGPMGMGMGGPTLEQLLSDPGVVAVRCSACQCLPLR
jgi:hypothetical protein